MPDSLSETVATARGCLTAMRAGSDPVDAQAEFVACGEDWLSALCDDNDRLRALLREYGRHQHGCSAEFNGQAGMVQPRPPYPCRCGWDEAEKTLEGRARS
jgi:hypothetical protein